MNSSKAETTLATVRLHWGIFIPAFLILFVFALLGLSFVAFLKVIQHMAAQITPQSALSNSWIIWLALLPAVLLFLLVLLVTWIAYLKSEVRLTNKRLIFRTGLLSRMSGDLPLENIESIFILEPILGRLCGYGTVAVTSLGGRAFPLRYIGSPQSFHATLQGAVAVAKSTQRTIVQPPATPPPDDDSRFMPKS